MKIKISIEDLEKIVKPFVAFDCKSEEDVEDRAKTIIMLAKVFGEEEADCICKTQN